MSETQEAPGGAAPDTASTPLPDAGNPPSGAGEAETGNSGGTEPEGAKAEAKPEREPWFVKRINELTREKADSDRVLAQAERELQRLRPQPDPNAAPDVNAMAEQRAQQLVAEREYNRACNASHDAGVAAYPDFGEAMQTLTNAGGLSRAVIEAALETGEAHKVLYQLGRSPEEAMRIGGLSPTRMGVALAKLAAQAAPAPNVTKAPSPVRSIGGGNVRPAEDPAKMSMSEFSAWREKQLAAKRAGTLASSRAG